MKKFLVWAALAAMVFSSCAKKVSQDEYGYTIKDNQIVYNTPPRPADQQSMLGFAAEPIEHVRIGLVGLGDRGSGAVRRLPYVEDATIVALCDLYPDRVEKAQKILEGIGAPRALYEYSGEEGYKQGLYVDHKNTIRNDNRAENLHWVTPKGNANNPLTLAKRRKTRVTALG